IDRSLLMCSRTYHGLPDGLVQGHGILSVHLPYILRILLPMSLLLGSAHHLYGTTKGASYFGPLFERSLQGAYTKRGMNLYLSHAERTAASTRWQWPQTDFKRST